MNVDIHGLTGAYAVDALDDAERADFERHLGQCPECRAELAGLQAAASELTLAEPATPPAALRDAVLADIARVRPLPPLTDTSARAVPADADADVVSLGTRRERRADGRGRLSRLAFGAVAAAAAAVLALGALVWSPWESDDPTLTATEQVLQAEDARRYEQTVGGARATIVRSASLGKAVIVADGMAPAPEGKDYQLWLQTRDGAMVSAGLLPRESAPTVTKMLEGDASQAIGAGITVEPAGGSPQPTSDPIALFQFS
jgi:anti-sigma-K factor RskA